MRLLVPTTAVFAFVSFSEGQSLFGSNPLEKIGDAIKDPQKAIENATKDLQSAIQDPAKAVQNFMERTSGAVGNTTKDIGDRLGSVAKDPIGSLNDLPKDTWQTVNETFGSARDLQSSAQRGANRTLNTGMNSTRSVSATEEDATRNPLSALQNATKDAGKAAASVGNNTIDTVGIIKDGGDVPNKTVTGATGITYQFGEGLTGVVPNLLSSLTDPTNKGIGGAIEGGALDPIGAVKNITGGLGSLPSMLDLVPNPFGDAISRLDTAVKYRSPFGILAAAGPALIQAISPLFTGGSALKALEEVRQIGDKAATGLPFVVTLLLSNPFLTLQGVLNVVATIQSVHSYFGSR